MSLFTIWKTITPACEILILWIVYYRILLYFKGTRAFHVLKGISYVLIVFLLAQLLGFNTLNWLLTKFFALSLIAFMIIFQQELRQGLARLGQGHMFSLTLEESEIVDLIDDISNCVYKLSRSKVGCLIAIEREAKLKTYIESGISLDAIVSSELLQSIFMTTSPIHDGGVMDG